MKSAKDKKLEDQLKDFLKGKVVILGIGNSMRGDDCSGIELAKRLRGKIPAEILEGSTKAENFVEPILNSRPNAVLVIDSFDFKEKAGAVKMIHMNEIGFSGFSNYSAATEVFLDTLAKKSHANIALLGIQPDQRVAHIEMSKENQDAIVKLEEIMIKIFSHR